MDYRNGPDHSALRYRIPGTKDLIAELDIVVLTRDLPDSRLKAGDVGTVVHAYEARRAYEIEFVALDGGTISVVTVEPGAIRPAGPNEIAHARMVA